MKKTQVVLSDTKRGIREAVEECGDAFGGVKSLLKKSGDVYIKVNAVDLKPYCFTDPEVIKEVILYFRKGGARNIYVIENCTQGNFTRIVFKATGITRVCRETGAIPVYLDETDAVPVFLEGIERFVDLSAFVYDKLVEHREDNLYVSLPKLKTHSMSKVTLSIKNQFGLVHQSSRIDDHNFRLHEKFAGIYRVLRPDFVIVDGLIATNHGHYIAENNRDKCVVPMDLLIGGTDPLAVDTVGAALMGFTVKEVDHLRLSKETGIGNGELKNINIKNEKLFITRKKKLTDRLLGDLPSDLIIHRGFDRCCTEGCRCNTETVAEVLYRDHGGMGGFTILMGKGISSDVVESLHGRIHIAGSCAYQDYGPSLVQRLGIKNVTVSLGCNNLADTLNGLCRHMKVSPLKLLTLNLFSSLYCLVMAKLNGTKARITSIR